MYSYFLYEGTGELPVFIMRLYTVSSKGIIPLADGFKGRQSLSYKIKLSFIIPTIQELPLNKIQMY